MKKRSGEKIKLTTYNDLFASPEEGSTEIEIKEIMPFKNHPFKVIDDDKMDELVESIREHGVLTPVLVRPNDEMGYEMISGHRRMHAATLAGLTTIPANVRELTDDEAVILMVDSNIQREEILPSERAFALKFKMDAMKRQGKKIDTGVDHIGPKTTAGIIGEEAGMSATQVKRYIRLTELIPEFLDMLDNKKMQFTIAVDISFVDQDVQKWLCEYIDKNGMVKPEQIVKLKEYLSKGNLNQEQVIQLLDDCKKEKNAPQKVTFTHKKLSQYFPAHYTSAEMEDVIVKLLDEWRKKQEKAGENNGDN